MDRIQIQASKLWDLLFAEGTAKTYQEALTLTATLLKETAQLIWLVICSVFVFGAWVSETSISAGKSIRNWVNEQGSEPVVGEESQPTVETGKNLLETGRTGITYLLNQAREQLGLESATPVATPQSAAPSQAKTDPAPSSSASTSTSTSPAPTSSSSTPPTPASPTLSTPSKPPSGATQVEPKSSPAATARPESEAVDEDDSWPPQDNG
ncbi:MAG: hypothetical protein WBD47_00220 [Phormidesmis sp.]